VINSPEVHLGIKILHEEVGHKNILDGPWKDLVACNGVLGRRPVAVPPKSSELAAVSGRARAGDGPRVPGGSITALGCGRGTTGGCGRRSGAVAAAGASALAKLHLRRGN
jgi:hypothetical protein